MNEDLLQRFEKGIIGAVAIKNNPQTGLNIIKRYTDAYDNNQTFIDIAFNVYAASGYLLKNSREYEVNPREYKEKYVHYLKTLHWNQTRQNAFFKANWKCQLCQSKQGIEVHHNNYNNLWKEEPADLVVLCKFHHDMVHFINQGHLIDEKTIEV